MKQAMPKSLYMPSLILGMPRRLGLALIATCLLLGFQFGHHVLAIILFVAGWGISAIIVKIDRKLPVIIPSLFWRAPSNHLRK